MHDAHIHLFWLQFFSYIVTAFKVVAIEMDELKILHLPGGLKNCSFEKVGLDSFLWDLLNSNYSHNKLQF